MWATCVGAMGQTVAGGRIGQNDGGPQVLRQFLRQVLRQILVPQISDFIYTEMVGGGDFGFYLHRDGRAVEILDFIYMKRCIGVQKFSRCAGGVVWGVYLDL